MPDVNGFLTPEERQANAQERLVALAQNRQFFGFNVADAFRAGVRDAQSRGRTTTDSIAAGLDSVFRKLRKRSH